MSRKLVEVIVISVLLAACAAKVPVPQIPLLQDEQSRASAGDDAFQNLAKFEAPQALAPLTPKQGAKMPKVGDTTSYGVVVTADLATAFGAYVRGDAPTALEALERARKAAGADARTLFEISMLRAQVYIMTGRSDAAEAEVARTEEHEIAVFNTNVNSRALRGEARVWASDFEGAINDLAQVAVATQNWRLPTSYSGPPTNMGQLFNLTTAQLRAYTAMAASYVLMEKFESALPWAARAEAGYADVFEVATHPLYGPYVPFHADSYYGRALNLAVLGAARLVVKNDRDTAKIAFNSAHALLDSIGFATPKITVDALHAQALLQAGYLGEAEVLAGRASAEASRRGLPDLVWRIEALRGEALLKGGRSGEAEAAFRRAQAAIELVSGALATDRAKRRFGIGKDDVTYRLVNFGIAKGDFAAVFRDLERGRARAFVDMLAGRAVATGRQVELSGQIRQVDTELRNLRLLAASPAGTKRDSRDRQARLTSRRDELTTALRIRDPELADVLAVSHRELADIQAVLEPGEILAYGLPSRGDELARVMLIDRSTAKIQIMGANNRDLAKVIRDLRSTLENGADRQQDIVDALGRLLKIADWGATRTLYVVPSGQLFFIPWGALDIKTPVAVLPTGGWLMRKPRDAVNSDAVVVGDPQFFGELPQLPGARREAERVGDRYGVEPLLGSAATEKQLRTNVGDGVQILHIASHAEFQSQRPLQSALILSGNGTIVRLTAERIYQQPIPARLVVLSACETGAGRVVAGDDILGLPRSFYLGGATTVINSLWPVTDEGTLAFMTAFHEGLKNGDIGSSWLAARDQLRRAGYPPLVYGAFVVGGSLSL
ncbi:MAG: CHAT domain-containing protein [Proteobacteria bacterium]|nr:CHAT domain-containing protein [Pseudomonadota bacterium]